MTSKSLFSVPPILLLTGAVVRIVGLGASAIWYDESITLFRATLPFWDLMSNRTDLSGDFLLDLLMRPLMAINHSLALLRLPSLLAGLLSLWLAWKLMQRLHFDPTQQTLAAAILACLPGLLWISQDARSYSLLACLALAGICFALEGRFLGLTAVCGLTIYCHSTGPAFALACLLVALYAHPQRFRTLLWCALGVILAWGPGIYRIFSVSSVLEARQPWWPHLTLNWLLNSLIQAFWTTMTKGPLLLLGLGTLLLSLCLLRLSKTRARLVLLCAWCVPAAMLILASLAWTNVIVYRTLMPLLPVFALWVGWELGDLTHARAFKLLTLTCWAACLVVAVVTWNPAARGGQLDRVAASIRAAWQPGDVLFYATVTVARPFDYYLPDLPHLLWHGTESAMLNESGAEFADTADLQGAGRVWLVLPREVLISKEEYRALDEILPYAGLAPVRTVEYMQAAPIDVFLVKRP